MALLLISAGVKAGNPFAAPALSSSGAVALAAILASGAVGALRFANGAAILASFSSSGAVAGAAPTQAFDYSRWGVPYVTDPVPAAIIPTLPTGADFTNHEWIGTYDPLLIAVPTATPGGASDEYYVKYNGNDGTAGQGGQGTSALPRRTLPTGQFVAGTKLFIEGDNTPIPTDKDTNRKVDFTDWSGNGQDIGDWNGTSANQCWWIGINKPRVETRRVIVGGSHTIADGIVFESGTQGRGSIQPQNFDYITIRNSWMFGNYTSVGHNQVNPANANFLCVFNTEIAYCGLFDSTNGSTPDWHGFRPSQSTRYAWIIDCNIHHMSGDSIQSGISNGWTDPTLAPHYMYYAGGDFGFNRENCIDNKNSFHVIMAKNECHDNLEQASTVNGTLITVAQDNEGTSSGFHWAIANELYNGVVGLRYSGNRGGAADTEHGFLINNLVRDCSATGLRQTGNGTTAGGLERYREITMLHNTVVRTPTMMYTEIDYDNAPFIAHGNLGYDVDVAYDIDSGVQSEYVENIAFKVAGTVTTSGVHDLETGTQHNVDPLLTNPGANDFTLQAGSIAIAQVPEHPVFQEFEDMYGIDIRFDYDGNTRPAVGNYDVGAFQRAA